MRQPDTEPSAPQHADQPRVLLLHGFFSCRAAWSRVEAELTPGVQPIAPDLLGYGSAGHSSATYSLDDLVDHLVPTVEREQPTHLVGHSMGGIVGLALAARLPQQFERVGVVGLPVYHSTADGLAHLYSRGWPYRALLRSHDVTHLGCTALYRSRALWSPFAHLVAPNQPREVLTGVFNHCRASHGHGLDGVVFGGHLEALSPQVTRPVFLLHGGKDRAAPPDRARQVAERHGWQFEFVPRHNHQSIIERPRDVARWIERRILCQPKSAPGALHADGTVLRSSSA